MSMSFGDDNEVRGGGGLTTGLAMGSMMNRREDQGQWIWAVIIFIIFVVIALVFLAFMRKDDSRKDYGGTDLAAILTPLIAAKGLECNNGYKNDYDHDHFEIKNQIAHSEDRREISGIKSELGAVALMMQKTASENEKDNLKEFGDIKSQLSALTMGMSQVLQTQNNNAIINGVIQQLMCGKPCIV